MKLGTRLLVSIGFAQGLMMTVWSLVFDAGTGYFYSHHPKGLVIAAYLLMLPIVAIVFACTYLPAKFRWALILPTLVMLDDLRWGLGLPLTRALPLAVLLLGGAIYLTQKKKITWLKLGTVSLELMGCVGIVIPLAALTLLKNESYASQRVSTHKTHQGRIVLAIFDELDPVHALEKWPSEYPENEFQKLTRRSITFRNCLQPGHETMYSLPAMTIGHTVEKAKPASPTVLNLIVGGQKRTWNEKPNVLLEARDTIGASILGWYHPYPRIFEGIDSKSYERVDDEIGVSFWTEFNMLIQRPFQLFHRSSETVFYRHLLAEWQRHLVTSYHDDMPQFVEDHDGLIMLHIPCPHPPYVMHPLPDDPLGSDERSYYGQVLYAGEMLKTLETKLRQTNEPYTLIVTSDHNLRVTLNGIAPCGRVPFFVTGSQLNQARTVDSTAYGEHVADLIRLLMKQPKADADAVTSVMTAHRQNEGPSD